MPKQALLAARRRQTDAGIPGGYAVSGRRPALMMGPAIYNSEAGLMVCCPLSTQVKVYLFEAWSQVGQRGIVRPNEVA